MKKERNTFTTVVIVQHSFPRQYMYFTKYLFFSTYKKQKYLYLLAEHDKGKVRFEKCINTYFSENCTYKNVWNSNFYDHARDLLKIVDEALS